MARSDKPAEEPTTPVEQTTDEQVQPDFVEQGLSLLSQTKLEELQEIEDRLEIRRAEQEHFNTQAAEIEAAREELLRFNADLKNREAAAAQKATEAEEKISQLHGVHEAQTKKDDELARREKHVLAREGELDTKESALSNREAALLEKIQIVAEEQAKLVEDKRLFADRETNFVERKNKLMALEKLNAGQA